MRRLWGMALLPLLLGAAAPDSFRFAIVGDRTGAHVPGVYEEVWKELAGAKPAFVLSVGDTIEGNHDDTAAAEWREAESILHPWANLPLYLTPGNHDIWSALSEKLFTQYAKHEPHYSFDYGSAHFTVLDNSRSDEFSAAEMEFLEQDLKAHESQPLKIVVSHRPSWILNVLIGDTNFPLHRIAKKYGVRYVLSGHIHEMFHAEADGVTYLSMESAGGHLRASGEYRDGWFFGYTVVDVNAKGVDFRIHEIRAPFGKGRVTGLNDWGKGGLMKANPN